VDAAEAHRQLSQVTGAQPYTPPPEEPAAVEASTSVAGNLGAALDALQRLVDPVNTFTVAVRELLEALDEFVDQDGREIWLRAGEVELDQWTQRVIDARDGIRRQLGTAP
jgi:hypothetical protein